MSALFLMIQICLLIAMLSVLMQCLRLLIEMRELRRCSCGGEGESSHQITLRADVSDQVSVRDVSLLCASRGASLTNREVDVLEYVYRGWRARAIGEALSLSDATIKTHMSRIYQKLGVHSQQEVISLVDTYTSKIQEDPSLMRAMKNNSDMTTAISGLM